MSAALDLRMIARGCGRNLPSGRGFICACPVPSHGKGCGDRNPSLSIAISDKGSLLVRCFAGCDPLDIFSELRRRGLLEDRRHNPQQRPRLHAAAPPPGDDERKARALLSAKHIASEIVPLLGTPGESYLRQVRKIDTTAVQDILSRTDAIGWHSGVHFNQLGHRLHGRRLGCIVGVQTDPQTAKPTGAISRTYIGPYLAKVGKAKTLGSPMGVVRLSADDEVLGGLYLAEGL